MLGASLEKGVQLLYRFTFVLWSLHHLYSPASLLGFASALGAFRATPETPHLEYLSPSGRALEALHPSQETSLKCMIMSSLINLYETQNSCKRARRFIARAERDFVEGILMVLVLIVSNLFSL